MADLPPPRNQSESRSAALHVLRDEVPAEHFNAQEFQCSDGTAVILLHTTLLKWLDELRREFGPTRINSGFRTACYNVDLGGASNSRHMYGLASDVDCLEVSNPEVVAKWAEKRGFGGIGRYNTFTHLDVWGENRRWNNRDEGQL